MGYKEDSILKSKLCADIMHNTLPDLDHEKYTDIYIDISKYRKESNWKDLCNALDILEDILVKEAQGKLCMVFRVAPNDKGFVVVQNCKNGKIIKTK